MFFCFPNCGNKFNLVCGRIHVANNTKITCIIIKRQQSLFTFDSLFPSLSRKVDEELF